MEYLPERIANTKENTRALIRMLKAQNLKYTVAEESDARTYIRSAFIGDDLPLTLHIILRTDRQIAAILSPMAFTFPKERIEIAAKAVAAANHGLIDGSFDLNLESGEIRFRLTSSYLNSVLSETLFSYLLYISAETVDRYNDRFYALSLGRMSLTEFIAADRKDRAPES